MSDRYQVTDLEYNAWAAVDPGDSPALPQWQSDGFRSELCGACGQRIGYGKFLASRINESAGKPVTLFHSPGCP